MTGLCFWKHRQEDSFEYAQNFSRKLTKLNPPDALATKAFCFPEKSHPSPFVIDIATFATYLYGHQFANTCSKLCLQHYGCEVSSPNVRECVIWHVVGTRELVEFVFQGWSERRAFFAWSVLIVHWQIVLCEGKEHWSILLSERCFARSG